VTTSAAAREGIMIEEFKKFALRGNMLDLAIAVILGGAFGAIVTSLVSDVLMPPLGKLLGGVDFSSLFVVLGGGSYPSIKAAKDAGAATINYGVFINTVINFVIVAAALFFVVKAMNRAMARPAPAAAPAAPTDKECAFCATRIPLAAKRCPHCTSTL
jgi:large conductance mechanosensitive channel